MTSHDELIRESFARFRNAIIMEVANEMSEQFTDFDPVIQKAILGMRRDPYAGKEL